MNNQEQKFLLKLYKWLYLNDGKFPNREGWRKAFVDFVEETIINLKD